jgi:hypothetical protein
MSRPELMDDAGRSPRAAPIPRWALITIFGLVGAYAGWWGEGFFAWTPAGGLIAANVVGWSVGLFVDWLRRALRLGAFPIRGLLAVVVVFGIVGGVFVGVVLWLSASIAATIVRRIEDDGLRTVAGAGAGVILGAICWWAASRRPKPQAAMQATDDPTGSNSDQHPR